MVLNKFQFIGNLTRDNEIRYTPESDARAIFDLGVNQQTGHIEYLEAKTPDNGRNAAQAGA